MQRKIFSFLLAFAAVVVLGSAASAQQKFTASMNPLQENPPVNSNGRGNCVITLNFAQTQITDVTCTFSQLTSGVTQGHIHGPAAPGANAGILFDLTPPTGVTSGTFSRGPFTLTADQLTLLRTKRLYVNIHTSNFPGGEIRGQIKIQTTPYDNDGDGRTDLRVYRPSTFTFHVLNSINNSIFNSAMGLGFPNPVTQQVIPLHSASDDYDGDGRGDLVLLRASNSLIYWRILLTGSNTIREVNWGRTDTFDDLVPADYDGDGKTDIAVYRFTTGIWYILQSSNNQLRTEFWGTPGNNTEYGMVGDFDRDGRNDLTILRPTANGWGWFTRRTSDNAMRITYWGNPDTDFFYTYAQIDIDGDGIQDRMVYRDQNPPTQTADNFGNQITFLILRSSDNGQFILPFGLDSDSFVFGDYDVDGRTDIVARRIINNQMIWFIYQSSNAQVRIVNWGIVNDEIAGEDESESDFAASTMLKSSR
ncbi:MAG TPA: CHRD domain-containing protein [Pyrinomonadaceae bacterium]